MQFWWNSPFCCGFLASGTSDCKCEYSLFLFTQIHRIVEPEQTSQHLSVPPGSLQPTVLRLTLGIIGAEHFGHYIVFFPRDAGAKWTGQKNRGEFLPCGLTRDSLATFTKFSLYTASACLHRGKLRPLHLCLWHCGCDRCDMWLALLVLDNICIANKIPLLPLHSFQLF